MKPTSWLSVAVVCAAVGGAGGQNPPPAPAPREKDAAWIPKPGSDPGMKGGPRVIDLPADPPSAFPDLLPPARPKQPDPKAAVEEYYTSFEKLCPRLFGSITLTVEATDDTLRKLLKARLHQGTFEFRLIQSVRGPTVGPPLNFDRYRACLADMQAAATELWAGQPKESVPWLEELLVASKEHEQVMRVRIFAGMNAPDEYYAARRFRLKMEAELWKAKHPK